MDLMPLRIQIEVSECDFKVILERVETIEGAVVELLLA
jgi:hypothetical protein